MSANTELDRIFGGEDGESPIRFADNPLRDSEQVVGRITRDHRWDRRYKPTYVMPEPITDPFSWREFFEIIGGLVVFSGLLGGLWLWAAILGTLTVAP